MKVSKLNGRMIFEKENSRLEFSLVDNMYKLYDCKSKDGRVLRRPYSFFTGYEIYNIIDMIDKNYEDQTISNYLKGLKRMRSNCRNMCTVLNSMRTIHELESYLRAGFVFDNEYEANSFSSFIKANNLTKIQKPLFECLKFLDPKTMNNDERKKTVVRIFSQRKETIQSMLNIINTDDNLLQNKGVIIRSLLSYGHISDTFLTIERHNLNLRRLLEYVVYIVNGESTDGTFLNTAYKDYLNMCDGIGNTYKKYPKYLKSLHDIVAKNYKLIKNEHLCNMYLNSYNGMYNKTYDKYSIVEIDTIEKLANEGNTLSHCVLSYANNVVDGRCLILGLRDNKDINMPLVTIELRGNEIKQALGYANRYTTPVEDVVINKYCKDMGIQNLTAK